MNEQVVGFNMTLQDLRFMPDIPELHEIDYDPTLPSSRLEAVQKAASGALSSVTSSLPRGLVYVDHLLDLIPFASTASNVIDLGLKHYVVKDIDPESSYFKAYIEHVQNKDTKECVAYGLPFLGTLAKIGTVTYGFFKPASTTSEDYQIVATYETEEALSLSTIGLRLREEEKAQADQIAKAARYPKSYPATQDK